MVQLDLGSVLLFLYITLFLRKASMDGLGEQDVEGGSPPETLIQTSEHGTVHDSGVWQKRGSQSHSVGLRVRVVAG